MEYENCHTFNITNKTETSIHSLSLSLGVCMFVLCLCVLLLLEKFHPKCLYLVEIRNARKTTEFN